MKTFKKLLTVLIIVLVAILAIIPTKVLAAEGDLTITVTGEVGGRTLSVYKLFNLAVEGEGDAAIYRYTWDGLASEAFFAQLTDSEGNSLGLDTVAKATDYLKGFENDATALTDLAEDFYAFCNDENNATLLEGKISKIGDSVTVPAGTENVEFTVPGKGYYLIYDETVPTVDPETGVETAVAAAMLQNVTKNEPVKLKAESIKVDKKVDQQTASVGDKVTFTISTTVPNVVGYDEFFFEVTDKLSKGLTLNNDIKVTIDGTPYTHFEVKTLNTEEGATEAFVRNEDGTTTLKITFDDEEFAKLNDAMGQKLVITYSATLNSNAATEKDNTNEATIEYSNDPETNEHGKTNTGIVHVYTYGFDFTKKDSAGKVLPGAEFVLKLSDGSYATFNENGVYTGKVSSKDDATVLVSDENGKIAVSGLEAASYTLVETKAPKGYSIPNFEFTFTISQELNEDGTLKSASFDYTADDNNNAANGYISVTNSANDVLTSKSFAVTVLNAKEGELPTTGGIGTTIFTIAGIVVMVIAGAALVIRNRKND